MTSGEVNNFPALSRLIRLFWRRVLFISTFVAVAFACLRFCLSLWQGVSLPDALDAAVRIFALECLVACFALAYGLVSSIRHQFTATWRATVGQKLTSGGYSLALLAARDNGVWGTKKRPELAGIPFPPGGERHHTVIIGATKPERDETAATLIQSLRICHIQAMVFDPGGELSQFCNPERDERIALGSPGGLGWNIFDEGLNSKTWKRVLDGLNLEGDLPSRANMLVARSVTALTESYQSVDPQRLSEIVASDPVLLHAAIFDTFRFLSYSDADQETREHAVKLIAALVRAKGGGGSLSIRSWLSRNQPGLLFVSSEPGDGRAARLAGGLLTSVIERLSEAPIASKSPWIIVGNPPHPASGPDFLSRLKALSQIGVPVVVCASSPAELSQIVKASTAAEALGAFGSALVLRQRDPESASQLSLFFDRRVADTHHLATHAPWQFVFPGLPIPQPSEKVVPARRLVSLRPGNGVISLHAGRSRKPLPIAEMRVPRPPWTMQSRSHGEVTSADEAEFDDAPNFYPPEIPLPPPPPPPPPKPPASVRPDYTSPMFAAGLREMFTLLFRLGDRPKGPEEPEC